MHECFCHEERAADDHCVLCERLGGPGRQPRTGRLQLLPEGVTFEQGMDPATAMFLELLPGSRPVYSLELEYPPLVAAAWREALEEPDPVQLLARA